MYAIIETGGKQYKVSKGDVIYVEKLAVENGAEVTFTPLLVNDGKKVQIGNPALPKMVVKATMVDVKKGQKIIVYKFKAKKNYRRKTGHRQPYSMLKITGIEKLAARKPAKKEAAVPEGKATAAPKAPASIPTEKKPATKKAPSNKAEPANKEEV